MWGEEDSNLRRRRQQIYSLPHLTTLESPQNLFRADGGIRTPDQLITNQLLWPTELHRHALLVLQKTQSLSNGTANLEIIFDIPNIF